MSRLSEKEHWDGMHNRIAGFYPSNTLERSHQSLAKKSAQLVKRLIGQTTTEKMVAYDDYLLWKVVFPQYFTPAAGAKVLEVGSAPGLFLIELNQKYGCIPYGVEY